MSPCGAISVTGRVASRTATRIACVGDMQVGVLWFQLFVTYRSQFGFQWGGSGERCPCQAVCEGGAWLVTLGGLRIRTTTAIKCL